MKNGIVPHHGTQKRGDYMDLIASINWQEVEVDPWFAWFKSEPISDDQYRALEVMLKALSSKFIHEGELFQTRDGVTSFTLSINLENDYWNNEDAKELSWFVENPKFLFREV